MPKWISIDEAAHKYGVKEEDICLWAEMEAITAYFTETTLIIDEKGPFRNLCTCARIFPQQDISAH